MDDIRETFRRNGLVRTQDGVLGGVCAGIGRRMGLNPWPARWLFLILLLIVPGSQLLVYPALWILMPSEAKAAQLGAHAAAPVTPTA